MHSISIWEHETYFAPSDIIIVGGGFLGLWTALELKTKNPSAAITILERGITPMGASSRNAGFACFGSPTEMISDASKMGEDDMWSIVEMRYKGIHKIRRHFKDSAIDYKQCGGYECFQENDKSITDVRDRLDWLNKGMNEIAASSQVFKWADKKLQQFQFEGFEAMIENEIEGGLHSGKLLQALMRKVISMGVNIMTGIQVEGWEKINDSIEVFTNLTTLKARCLIICTNALSPQLTLQLNVEPARGQVLVTEPIEDLKMQGTFHYDEGYYYFRNVGNRILIGGARNTDFVSEHTTELSLNNAIQGILQQFVATHLLPRQPFKIDYEWSGIMAFTENKLPVINKLGENIYAAVCCNGMGVALSPIIAEQISLRIEL